MRLNECEREKRMPGPISQSYSPVTRMCMCGHANVSHDLEGCFECECRVFTPATKRTGPGFCCECGEEIALLISDTGGPTGSTICTNCCGIPDEEAIDIAREIYE